MSPTTKIEMISPDEARRILERNTDNRSLRQAWIDKLCRSIRDGEWRTTHQGIAIATSGRLLDGQHRLHAIMASGRTVPILVTRNADEDDYKYIDAGNARTVADRIQLMHDAADNRMACAILRSYCRINLVDGHDRSREVPITMIEDTFLEYSDAWEWAAQTFRVRVARLTLAPVAAALATFYHKHKAEAERFTEQYLSGAELSHRSPALVLRNAMHGARVPSIHDQYWKTIWSCHMFHEGKSIDRIQAASRDFLGNVYFTAEKLYRQRGLKSARTKALDKHGASESNGTR